MLAPKRSLAMPIEPTRGPARLPSSRKRAVQAKIPATCCFLLDTLSEAWSL